MFPTNSVYKNGILFEGYDAKHGAYVHEGKYVTCDHAENTCACFGRLHAGETIKDVIRAELSMVNSNLAVNRFMASL